MPHALVYDLECQVLDVVLCCFAKFSVSWTGLIPDSFHNRICVTNRATVVRPKSEVVERFAIREMIGTEHVHVLVLHAAVVRSEAFEGGGRVGTARASLPRHNS
jgi:hypothetical protein